jgi:hypothetical protein
MIKFKIFTKSNIFIKKLIYRKWDFRYYYKSQKSIKIFIKFDIFSNRIKSITLLRIK